MSLTKAALSLSIYRLKNNPLFSFPPLCDSILNTIFFATSLRNIAKVIDGHNVTHSWKHKVC